MATTRTPEEIQADLDTAQATTAECPYKHSKITADNYARLITITSSSNQTTTRYYGGPANVYYYKTTFKLYVRCRGCGASKVLFEYTGSEENSKLIDNVDRTYKITNISPYHRIGNSDQLYRVEASRIVPRLKIVKHGYYNDDSGAAGSGYTVYDQSTSINFSSNMSSLLTHGVVTRNPNQTEVTRYREELATAQARDNAISSFNSIDLSGVPNRETAQQALAQLEIALTNGGSSYSGYQAALAKYNEYSTRLSKQEQLTLSIDSLSRLHGNITNTMLPNKVNKYTEIHTNGVGYYNKIKTFISLLKTY